MKADELRGMSQAELNKQLDDLYQETFNMRFQRASGQLSNPNRLVQVRRDIARVKTFLRQQELAGIRAAAVQASDDEEPVSLRERARRAIRGGRGT